MDEHLKHLKESMDRTILKNGTFRPDEKRKILQAIKQRPRRRRSRLGAGLTVAISFCVLVGLSWFVFSQLQSQPKNMASKSTHLLRAKDSAISKKDQKTASDAGKDVHTMAKDDTIQPYNSKQELDANTPYYTYVVWNQYYFKETGEMIDQDKLGQEIGRVKRTGDWAVKQSGDSNDIPSGPIYAVHGKDPADYIAVKGTIFRNGKMQEGYLLFKKSQPVRR